MNELRQLSDELLNSGLSDKQAQFIEKYGKYFGNNAGLGVALFNEAERAGINTDDAMIEAIQDMMNQIRHENNMLTEALSIVTDAAQKSSEKLEQIDNAVSKGILNHDSAESSSTPDTVMSQVDSVTQNAEEPLQSNTSEINPQDEIPENIMVNPDELGLEPAEQAPAEQAPADSMPIEDVLSDARIKRLHRLRGCLSDYRSKRILGVL